MTHTPVVPEQIDLEVEAIIAQVSGYMTSVDPLVIRHEIWRAYEFARDAHSGQVRKSGDPYILHPVMATKLLLILKPDIVTIQCCLLHDVPEDTDRNIDQIRRVFGPTVAHIVGGMEKLTKVKYH